MRQPSWSAAVLPSPESESWTAQWPWGMVGMGESAASLPRQESEAGGEPPESSPLVLGRCQEAWGTQPDQSRPAGTFQFRAKCTLRRRFEPIRRQQSRNQIHSEGWRDLVVKLFDSQFEPYLRA
jgi:hypothetical protein